ncbi:3'-5' exonuclease [Denitratisoma sp. agr-D3]
MTPVLVFDIETIPDIAGLRRLHELPDELSDSEVAEYAFQKQRAKNGSDFLPHHLQRVAVISFVLRSDEGFKVVSLAEPQSGEADIIQMFFKGIEKYTPQLVSWNGGGFDLPVLNYRGLIHGATAPRYWDMGEGTRSDFKWNNYISRYHQRHLDLMDLLALYQPRASVPLDELAKLMGFPGKLGMDGSAVWQGWLDGKIDDIRDYCETDVVNTYLVYLGFQKMRTELTIAEYEDELALVRQSLTLLADAGAEHWRRFLAAWPQ